MESQYLKKAEVKSFSFNYDWKQIWHHAFDRNRLKVDYVYIKNFASKSNEKKFNESLIILEFLYTHKMATLSQLEMVVKIKGFDDTKVGDILEDFINSRVCNAFSLAAFDIGEFPEDCFMIYTLDFGAKTILSHFGKSDTTEWFTSDVMRSGEIISKYLATNQFFLSLFKNKGKRLTYFASASDFTIGNRSFRVSADFAITEQSLKKEYILDVYRNFDLPVGARTKAEKIDAFFFGKHIKRYFDGNPVLLLLAENLEDATLLAKVFYKMSPELPVRLLTDESIFNGITPYSFYKYDPEQDVLMNVKTSAFV